jgi:hypothetical protein
MPDIMMSQEWEKLTVRLVKPLGQAVYTNESRVEKINSKTSRIIITSLSVNFSHS